MKKRAASQRVSDTKKKKEIARKAKNAHGTSEKTEKKRKRKIAPKEVKKTKAGKVKVQAEEKVKRVRGKEKQKPVRGKISSKLKRGKAEPKGKTGEEITKTDIPGKKKIGKVVAGTRRIRKPEDKSPRKRGEKVSPKVAGRVRRSKALAPKTAEKIKARVVSEVPVKEKISERIVNKKVVPSGVREVVAGKAKAETRVRPRKVIKGAGEGEVVRGTTGAGQGEVGKVAAKEVTGLQEAEVERKGGEKAVRLRTPRAVLPEEYGENFVTLMTVDPYRLFAFWEVREKTLEIFRGKVDIRVYDVTDIDFDVMDANSYLDIRADARIGKCYISVAPEREYLADAGIIFDGIFIAIARSARVSTPRATVSAEGISLCNTGETGFRTGY